MKFSSLGLAIEIQQSLDSCGYDEMTPVQELAIPPARRGKDLLVNAQTGTGKTASFALPILQQMIDKKGKGSFGPAALILTPTRELAEQLADTIGLYAQFLDFTVSAIFSGMKMGGQSAKLKAGVDILIATPGRLLEHLSLNNLSLANVELKAILLRARCSMRRGRCAPANAGSYFAADTIADSI